MSGVRDVNSTLWSSSRYITWFSKSKIWNSNSLLRLNIRTIFGLILSQQRLLNIRVLQINGLGFFAKNRIFISMTDIRYSMKSEKMNLFSRVFFSKFHKPTFKVLLGKLFSRPLPGSAFAGLGTAALYRIHYSKRELNSESST